MLSQFKLHYLGDTNFVHQSDSFFESNIAKRGKLTAQWSVSLSEVFKLPNELQINLTQHWCGPTRNVNVLHGWLDGSDS